MDKELEKENISPILEMQTGGLERQSDLSKVTQGANGKARN